MIRILLKALLFSLFVFVLPATALAKSSMRDCYEMAGIEAGLDSVPKVKQSGDKTKEQKKPEIKEVPKSRRQLKPSAVKDRLKTKPVKIPKPKVIKNIGRGLKLIK
jgi:hypothetical protein